ncbi:hypothetical protein PybrP1_006792 [[Pythium] brassicae (nom. inval.)]|nr:hypothetical protein PybrP1_006792 [[Pythium] brassicae (nom. inval.)]
MSEKLKSSSSSAAAAANARKKPKKTRKAQHIAPPKMKSRRKARQVTTDFHRLTRALDDVARDESLSCAERNERVAAINVQLSAIGGRSAYQDARCAVVMCDERQSPPTALVLTPLSALSCRSILSTSFHRTSKWVFQLLTKFGLRPKAKEPSLRVLEVGAINTQLLSCPWLDVRAIDLNSRHERIEQRDFFDLAPAGDFRVLVSSMVLNCVPDAESRGRMLQLMHAHLQPGGLAFLMVPLLCLRNSKFMTYARFVAILRAVGFAVRETKDSPKVAFFCLEKQPEGVASSVAPRFPQKLLAHGDKRNDFSVVL